MKLDDKTKQRLKYHAKRAAKPFIHFLEIDTESNDFQNVVDIFNELGCYVYEDPGISGYAFVSNVPLTYQWYMDHINQYPVIRGRKRQLNWLKNALRGDVDLLDQELELL